VRLLLKNSQESLISLSRQYGINPKTVAKWKKGEWVQDAPMGSKVPCSTFLSVEEEVCIASRKHTLLPLDDCSYALQSNIPTRTRSSLHLLFKRHGISRLPEIASDKLIEKEV
jgi:hypothetical protein